MIFHDYTMLLTGEIHSHRVHDSEKLAPEAVGFFAKVLEEYGDNFHVEHMQPAEFAHIDCEMLSFEGEAIATFSARGRVLTESQIRWSREAKSIVDFPIATNLEYPYIVSVPALAGLAYPDDLQVVADMETCLAAALFARKL